MKNVCRYANGCGMRLLADAFSTTRKQLQWLQSLRKLKDFYRNQKNVVMKKSTTGPQCKPTRNKHGMVTRLTC